MPIFQYRCCDCENEWEVIVITSQSGFGEPSNCPNCRSEMIEKVITAPAQVRMDGKAALQTLPDPTPPLQRLKEQGPREGCEGGYADLPEFKPTERKKGKDGTWHWSEKKKQHFDMGKK